MFRDYIQIDAINILGGTKKKEEAKEILEEIATISKSERVWRYVKNIIVRFERKKTQKNKKPPFPVGQEIP